MRQLIKILLPVILCLFLALPSHSALKGKLDYRIPIDYSKLSEEELDAKAGIYYNLALKTSTGNVNDEVTAALNLYAILCNKNPENIFYKTRLGTIYDLINEDKYVPISLEIPNPRHAVWMALLDDSVLNVPTRTTSPPND